MRLLDHRSNLESFGLCNKGDIKDEYTKVIFFCKEIVKYCYLRKNLALILVLLIWIYYNTHQEFMDYRSGFLSVSGELFDNSKLNNNSSNGLNLTNGYKSLLEKNFPFPIQRVDNIISPPLIVSGGIVISNNIPNDILSFAKIGKTTNLNLSTYVMENNIPFYSIVGDTAESTDSFISVPQNYSNRYISLNFGEIWKQPELNQVSLRFDIKGENNSYSIIFVHGRLYHEGWSNTTLFQKIISNSSVLVDLFDIVKSKGDNFKYLDNISINVERGTLINWFPFRIDLGKSTINPPDLLIQNESYYVSGNISKASDIQYNYRYLFEDWEFKQILNQQFVLSLDIPYTILSNGWKIINKSDSRENNSGVTILQLVSEKTIPLTQISPLESFPNVDFLGSILVFGSAKDLLFISVLILMILLFYFGTKNRKSNR